MTDLRANLRGPFEIAKLARKSTTLCELVYASSTFFLPDRLNAIYGAGVSTSGNLPGSKSYVNRFMLTRSKYNVGAYHWESKTKKYLRAEVPKLEQKNTETSIIYFHSFTHSYLVGC